MIVRRIPPGVAWDAATTTAQLLERLEAKEGLPVHPPGLVGEGRKVIAASLPGLFKQ
jgi:hypothetical protein